MRLQVLSQCLTQYVLVPRWARLLSSWSLRGSQHLLPWERFLERENVWRQVYGRGMSFGIFCLESWLAFTFQDIIYCHLVTLYVVSSSWWQAVWRINSTRPAWLFREFSAPLYGNPHDHCKCPHIFDQTPYIFLAIDHFNNVIREAVDKSEVETSLGPAHVWHVYTSSRLMTLWRPSLHVFTFHLFFC